MDPFLIKLQKFTYFLATKQIISSVLIICQRSLNAHFKDLKFLFKMSIRKIKSVDQVESQSTFSKKKVGVPSFLSKQVMISQKLFIYYIYIILSLQKRYFYDLSNEHSFIFSDNYVGSNYNFFDANHEMLIFLSQEMRYTSSERF